MDRMANGSSHLFAGKARIIAQYLINCLAIADLLQDEIHTNARTRDDGLPPNTAGFVSMPGTER
jgi:hypothetical protein